MANASQLRRLNERRIVESMIRLRRASQAQLAVAAGMSQPTVSRIVEGLIRRGLMAEAGGGGGAKKVVGRKGVVGRPSTRLELEGGTPRFLAIELGVNTTRVATCAVAVPEVDRWDVEIETAEGAGGLGRVAGFWKRLAAAVEEVRPKKLEGTVVSLPGVIEEETGKVLLSANVRWTETANLGKEFGAVVKGPVRFTQEIRALALGHMARAEGGVADFLLVDFGSGVGAAAVLKGKLYSGPLPMSGEIGHTPVLGNMRACGCGGRGCLETLMSRRGLLASAKAAGIAGGWMGLVSALDQEEMPGWLVEALSATAVCVAGAMNTLGLRHVVLTGFLLELPEEARRHLNRAIRGASMWARFGEVEIEYAARHRLAGMVCLAIDQAI